MDCDMAIKEWIKGETKNRVKFPKHYQVLIYNDDFTPMDFVVKVLMQVFDKEEQEATALMMSIHTGSSAVAGEYPKDIAVFPDDRHVASINHQSNTITFFKLDYEKKLMVMSSREIRCNEPNSCVIVKVAD